LDTIIDKFKTFDIGKNKDFGIAVVKHGGYDFEVANFRKDGTYSDGRRPDSVEIVGDFKDDASRRDFSINAMAVDKEGNIIDYFNGIKDIQNKIIRTVGDAHKRFGEDFLRMLRAPRFASRLGFKIDPETLEAIKTSSGNIKDVAMERVLQELTKMAKQSGDKFADAILILKDTGLLQHILPEVLEMDSFEHSVEHHPEGNVFQHTIAALRANKSSDPIINLSILLHDVGKTKTHSLDDNGLHRYLGHAKEAVDMIDVIANRLKMDTKTKEALKFAAGNHMKFHELLKMKDSTIAKLMNNPNWDILQATAEADGRARGKLFSDKDWNDILNHVNQLKAKFSGGDALEAVKKVVNGSLVSQARPELKPGPMFGKIIAATIDWVLNNNIDITDTAAIIDFMKNLQ